jgi:hypothetical protein
MNRTADHVCALFTLLQPQHTFGLLIGSHLFMVLHCKLSRLAFGTPRISPAVRTEIVTLHFPLAPLVHAERTGAALVGGSGGRFFCASICRPLSNPAATRSANSSKDSFCPSGVTGTFLPPLVELIVDFKFRPACCQAMGRHRPRSLINIALPSFTRSFSLALSVFSFTAHQRPKKRKGARRSTQHRSEPPVPVVLHQHLETHLGIRQAKR